MRFIIYLCFILLFVACGGGGGTTSSEQTNASSIPTASNTSSTPTSSDPSNTTDTTATPSTSGGSSSTTSTTTTTSSGNSNIKEAVLFDATVIGARYDAGGGITGVTDSNGKFRYVEGRAIKFYVGDVFLGEGKPINKPSGVVAVTNKIVTPLELAQTTDINDSKALKIVRFLMALDDDNNASNGMKIVASRVSGVQSDLNDSKDSDFQALTLPSFFNARKHLCESMQIQNCSTSPILVGEQRAVRFIGEYYSFIPQASGSESASLHFSVENLPSWATFNATTGEINGVIPANANSSYDDIKITVTDGNDNVSLAPFSIGVLPAIDVAHKYGKATQGTDKSYYYYQPASYAIDNNDSTNNHTSGGKNGKNWLQIELPHPTKISKIVIQNANGNAHRLTNAKVYISDTPYSGTVDANNLVKTLQPTNNEQIIEFTTPKSGNYLLIKGEQRSQDDRHIHLRKVEVYGEMPPAPFFENNITTVTIDKWQSTSESILSKKAIDRQDDSLTYTLQGSVPFRVDVNGSIFVSNQLNVQNYHFTVEVSDGTNSVTTPIDVNVTANVIVKEKVRNEVSSPALSGYLPNIYSSGDSVSIRINGTEYTATVQNGKWYLNAGEIASLAQGNYNVTVIVHGQEVTYTNYFSIDGRGFKSFTKTVTATTISTLNLTVVNHTERTLPVGEKVRGTSVELNTTNGKVYLVNDSYREIDSLIGTYVDSSGNQQFVKLQFNQHILPYSSNELASFTHDNNMSIYHTANMFNAQLSFGGEACDANTDTSTTHYCVPTTSLNQETYSSHSTGKNEQKFYSIAWATYHHLYNSIHGFNSFKAWVNKSSYAGLNLSGDYQSSPSFIASSGMDREDFMYNRFFGMVMPNHRTEMRAMRYKYAAEGMAGLPGLRALTSHEIFGSWASIWEGSIYFENHTRSTTNPFNTIHHEMMHSFAYDHRSGMTYGWSYALEKVVPYFYTNNAQPIQNPTINPTVHAPKYIFKSKLIGNNKIELKLYKTNDATQNDISFELFSATKLLGDDITETMGTSNDTVVLTYKPNTLQRFFIAVYGSDSLEIMSELFEF